jgi:hypothetical protein
MPDRKKKPAMQASRRKQIAVRLTDDELARARELAGKYHTLSTDIFTLAIRAALNDEKYLRQLLDRTV